MLSHRGIHGFRGRGDCIIFRRGLFDWNWKIIVPFLRVKSNRRASRPLRPPRPLSQMHLIKVSRSPFWSKRFKDQIVKLPRVDTTPQSPGASFFSYVPEAYKIFMEKFIVKLLRGSLDWTYIILVLFFLSKSD